VEKKEVFRNGTFHNLVFLAVTPKTWRPLWKKWKSENSKNKERVANNKTKVKKVIKKSST
jgi:hypothetical protein